MKNELQDTNLVPRELWETFRITKVIKAPDLKTAIASEHLAKIVVAEIFSGPRETKLPDIEGLFQEEPQERSGTIYGFNVKEHEDKVV